MNEAKRGSFAFEDLSVGENFRQRYTITADVYGRFLELFGDVSPLHVDDRVARSCGFSERLMHGAILNGFISNFVGMSFPGKRTLELGVDIKFLKPTHVGDVLELEATVKERLESRQVVVLHFVFWRNSAAVARGVIMLKLCEVD